MKRLFQKKLIPVSRITTGDMRFERGLDIHKAIYLFIFIACIGVSFGVLLFRLFQLTVVKGAYYLRLSEENRMREITIEARRGTIIDRKGLVIVESKEGNVNAKTNRIVSERHYHVNEEIAHLVGYRQVADTDDLKNDSCLQKLRLGDKVGKKGIERIFDCELRGLAGEKITEVDAHGVYLRTIAVLPPVKGNTVQLSVDLDLQKKAYDALKGKKGAIVVTNPKNGEILAFISTPSFDPQKFEDGDNEVKNYFEDPAKPLFNRITEASYPPGSIFKLFVATGALEDKKIDEDTIVVDKGSIKAGPLTFGNWYFLQYGKTEGPISLVKALRRSNDIYFYKVGEKLGPVGIKKWASFFGLGEKLNMGFEETEGLIPSPFWKEEVLKEQWYLGDTYNLSIGQGYTLLSLAQLAHSVLPFATGGTMCHPIFLKNSPAVCKKLPISTKTMELIREGMRQACSPGGTGWPLFDFKVKNEEMMRKKLEETPDEKKASVGAALNRDPLYFKSIQTGCKTGTAESHGKSGMPHALFTAFAPYDNPEIAVTVLVEEGGQGSDVAGPIVKDILTSYFERSE